MAGLYDLPVIPRPATMADRDAAPTMPLPPLSEDERASLLSRIGSGTLHGLGWLGGSISKALGGRAIRGGIGKLMGKSVPDSELLSWIPLSDSFNLTNPENEVHGSDLLGGNRDTGFFTPEGIGGLGIDIFTDPLTYLTFGGGALTKLGKTAEKLNLLPKAIGGVGGRVAGFAPGSAEASMLATGHAALTGKAVKASEVAGQRLGGHVGVGLPFMEQVVFDLTGPAAAAMKIPGVTPIVNAVGKVTAPIGRTFSGLFNKDAKGFSDEIFQPVAMKNSQKGVVAAHGARTEATPIMLLAQEMVKHAPGEAWDAATHGAASEALGKKLVMYIEMLPNNGKLGPAQQAVLDDLMKDPQLSRLGNMMIDQYGKELAANKAAGYADSALEGMGFTHRQSTQKPVNQGGLGKAWNDLSPEEQVQRNKMFGGMYTEGPQGINQLSKDKSLIGLTADDAEKIIREQYLGITKVEEDSRKLLKAKQAASITAKEEGLATELLNKARTGNITAAEQAELDRILIKKSSSMLDAEKTALAALDAKWEQAKDLAGWHKGLDHDALEKVGGFFGHHPLAMFEEYKLTNAGRRLNAESAFELLPNIVEKVPTQGSKSLRGVMAEVGMPIDVIGSPAHDKLMKTLGLQYANDFEKLTISKENAQKLMGFIKPAASQAPEAVRPVLALYDSMINLVKAGQTSWPATQMRNVLSDIYKRWTGGGEAFKPLVQAKTLREGGTIEGLVKSVPRFAGMTDDAATKQLWTEMYQLGLLDTAKYQAVDAVGTGLETIAKSQPVIGARQPGFWEGTVTNNLPGKGKGTSWLASPTGDTESVLSPFNVRGVKNPIGKMDVPGKVAEESKFLPVAMTQSAQNYFEEMNRIATYIDATKRGFNPLAAMSKVIEAHHDFSAMSGFEKDVMRRIVPFWSWIRSNVPQVASELASNPGGRMAQTMRMMTNMQSRNAFVPEGVGKTGYAIPIGGVGGDKKQPFLTSTGLPMEDLNILFSLGNAMSGTTPALRIPYELATGRSVYGANELPTNYPLPIGGAVPGGAAINALFSASPLARAVSQGRIAYQGISDPSEQGIPSLLRLGLGARAVNVNQEQARRQAVEQYVRDATAGNPLFRQFNNLYTRPEDRARLTPQEMTLLRLYQDAQQNRLGAR